MARQKIGAASGDVHGESVTIEHGDRRQEWLWFFDAEYFDPRLPLFLQFTGNSIWGPGVRIARRRSRIFAMELVTAGNIELVQEGAAFLAGAGQIFFLRRNCNHEYRTGPAGFAHKRIICLGGDMVDTMVERMGLSDVNVLAPADTRGFIRIVKNSAQTHAARPPGFVRTLSELAYAALLYAGMEQAARRHPPPVQAALDMMHQSLGRSLALEELARAAGVSVPHFCRLFQQHMGAAPLEHFRSIKVRLARELLTSTTARIKEIARRLGYDNLAHFTRLFVKDAGVSPREFRRRNAANTRA